MVRPRFRLVLAGLLGTLAAVCSVGLLGTAGWLISRAAEMPPVLTLTVAAVMVRAFALGRAVLRYAERLVGHDAALRGLTRTREAVYAGLESLAPARLAAFTRGDLLSRLGADVDATLDLPLRVVLPWAQAVLVSAVTVLFMAFLLPGAGLVVGLLAVCALAVVPWVVSRTARSAQRRIAPAKAQMSSAAVRLLDSTADLTVFGANEQAMNRVRSLDGQLTAIGRRESFALGFGDALSVIVQGAAVCLSLALGVVAVLDGRLEPVWLAVAALVPLALFDVLNSLPSAALAFQRVRGSEDRIEAVTIAGEERVEPYVEVLAGFDSIQLASVVVGWTDVPVLHDISLRIDVGERIGIVGPSGAGKSTLAALLVGLLPYQGSARINGLEIRDVDPDQLRQRVGLLAQNAHVFDATLADNLRVGDPEATDQQLLQVLARVGLDPLVTGMANGINTEVGAFGAMLSGGERQRISIARVLLAGRPFVILDEPTEHLDEATASAVSSTLAEVFADSTTVTITHRLHDISAASRIVELQDGRVTAVGSHLDLLAAGGWYAQQWRVEAQREDMVTYIARLPVGIGVPGPNAVRVWEP